MKPINLTAAQKRVAIAKDVLKQISARRIKIHRGVFVRSHLDNKQTGYNQTSVQKLESCTACAVGAAIISAIRLFNKIATLYIDSPCELANFFSEKQVELIEVAFEQGGGYYKPSAAATIMRAVKFGGAYQDNTERARAIFRNIIKNKGMFVP